jgi:predicted aspartyl protease
MKKIKRFLLCGYLLYSCAMYGQIQRQTDTIPFEIVHGKFIIDVSIHGKPVKMIMDTGGINTITADTVAHYGVTLSDNATFSDVNNARLNFSVGTADNLLVGKLLKWEAANMTVVPNNGFFRSIGVAGSLGGETFQAVCLTIDKRNKRFIVTYPYRPEGISRMDGTPMNMGANFQPKVPMNIGGKNTNVLFDTGMSGFLTLGQQDYERIKTATEIRQTGYGFMHVGIGGIKNARQDSLYKINIPVMVAPGGKEFHNVNTVVLRQSQTIAGQDLLDYGKVMLDYPRRLFYFFPYDKEPVDMNAATAIWNIKVLPVAGRFEVTAAIGISDFRIGDRVWDIDGIDLTELEQNELLVDEIFNAIKGDTAWILIGNDKSNLRRVMIRKM